MSSKNSFLLCDIKLLQINVNHRVLLPKIICAIATVSALGTPLGCLLSSLVMGRGRKISMFVTSLISMTGWVTIYMSNSYVQILIGRSISGISTGMASVPTTVYVAEIAGAKWRGTMVTWTSISIALGVLIVYIFGYIFKVNAHGVDSYTI